MNENLTLSKLNALSQSEYMDRLDTLYDHSPWIVELSERLRPFETVKAMQAAFEGIIFGASAEKQNALLCSHPDLAAKLEQLECLTDFSKMEQTRAGFASLPKEELAALRSILANYSKRFGHPFILCVSDHPAAETLAILRLRINQTAKSERLACLAQVARIGWHRLQSLVATQQ